MVEYWHYNPQHEERSKEFFSGKETPEMQMDFEIAEKDFIHSGKASSANKALLKRLGVDSDTLRRVAIASYEAEINITAHALGGKIFCYIHPDLVHIIFSDYGPGLKDIEQALIPGFSTASQLVREMGFGAGLGLPNIKKNSDVLHIESAENQPTKLEILVHFKK
ncbi:MAG: ATP-binding protein [Candidatus Cloacimonetes bacterium]|nr:ATP-binding protein [Candidatus Cloacimonadota bacterium]